MNAFDVLGLPQRLTLTSTEIDTAFRESGKTQHPDAGGDEQTFTRLREARTTLASPASRLAHWLEIQGEIPNPRGTIAPEIMDLFAPVGQAVQEADTLARRRDATTTSLGLALLKSETLRIRELLESMIARIDATIVSQCAPFASWEAQPPHPDLPTATIRNLRFLEKWKASLMAAYATLA
ncbi:MAG: hypothetical protein ACNA8L_04920 [Luteolibacter sp.]